MLPDDEILKKVPEFPVAKYWTTSLSPFIAVIPLAAVEVHFTPPATALSAVKTKLFVPTGSLISVDPAPTSKSPVL